MSEVTAKPKSTVRRLLRRVLTVAGGLLLVAILLIAIVLAALRSTDARRALIARVSNAIRTSTGLEITAADAAVDWSGRRVVLDRVTVAAEGAGDRAFLTIERVAAVLDAASLVRGPLHILVVEAQEARLDLSAPLPESMTRTATEPAGAPPDIEHFLLDGVTIVGMPLPEATAERLGDVRVERVRATGWLRGGRLELAIDRGDLLVSGKAPAAGLRASVAGHVAGPLQGPFALDEIRLAGDGLTAQGDGVLGLAASDPLSLRATAEAAPGRLFPEAGDGRVSLDADLDLRGVAGTIEAEASAMPAELLEAVLGTELFASLGAGGTFLDGDVRLRLAGRDRAEGTAHVLWRESGSDPPLLIADLATVGVAPTSGAVAPAIPVELDVDARVMPAWGGRRTVVARLRLPSWQAFSEVEMVTARADVVTADVARMLDDIDTRFPGLLPALPTAFPIAGPLTLTAHARGPVLDPELDLEAEWRPQPQTSIVLRGGGRPHRPDGAGPLLSGRATVTGLDLSTLEPLRETIAAGSAGGVVDFDVDGGDLRAHATVSSRDLVLTSDRRLDSVELEVSLTPPPPPGTPMGQRLVRIVRADVTSGEARVEATGTLDLDLQSSRPLLGGTIEATIHHPVEGVDRIDARLALARGVLEVDIPAAATDYGLVSGRMTLPLGALAAVPALADGVADLPTPAATGPVEVTLTAPALEAAALLERLGVTGPDVLHGDVGLTLTADLDQPAASAGVLTVRDLAASAEGAAIAARSAIDLRLAGGRLTLEPVTIAMRREEDGSDAAVKDLELEVAASVELERAWKIGDPIASLLGPLRVDASAEALDGAALFAALGIEPPFESLAVTGTELHLALDPNDPAAATGELEIASLDAVLLEDHRLRLQQPLAIRIADRALELEPAVVEIDGQTMTVAGGARFDPDWRRGQPATELIAELDASLRGVLEAEALAPYLAGASMSGRLAVDVAVSGTLEQLAGHASLAPGEAGAEVVLLDPYYTQLTDPRVELSIAEGRVEIESATAELNEGTLRITGGAVAAAGTLDLEITLDNVRYRLDYGLMTENEAWLRLTRNEAGAMRLTGRIWMERGFLRRDLDPDREVLSYFFAPDEIEAPSALDDLELDLELATVDGVRIRNNLADLRASWAPLEITGTLAAPLIDGTIDVDPGGYLFAFGQTVRVDSAEIDFAGDGSPATIDLETTTSWEDPTVAQVGPGGRTFLDSLRGQDDAAENQAELDEALARGFAGYYGERVARRLSESLGGVEVSLRPILVFGLDNPGTEITVSRDLSPQVTAAISVSLREEGRQTYVADLHEIDTLPRFIGQLYTLQTEPQDTAGGEVERAEGVVAQQRLLFGGTPADEGHGPRLRRLVLDMEPKVVSKRAIKRRLGIESGRPLADGAAFEAQIETLELLRRRGYPGADVEVAVVPVPRGDGRGKERADLQIAITPGQHVRFEFRGVEMHPRQRTLITSIYRPDFLEPVALDEMREQAVRGLHADGYLDPEISIDVLAASDDRVITIDARASRRVRASAPRIEGVDADAEAAIAARFVTTLSRVELALGEPVAERRLMTALREYGYPDARVLDRRLESLEEQPRDAGERASLEAEAVRPVISVEAPPRQIVAGVSIVGRLERAAEMTELAGLAELSQLEPVRALEGEPVRADHISSAAFAIEDELHARGQARVRVRSRLLPAAEGGEGSGLVLRYEVDRADAYQVEAVAFEGLRSTRSDWAREVAGLDAGAVLDPEALHAARRRLYQTGLFSSVLPEIDYDASSGDAGANTTTTGLEPSDAGVVFAVRERPRFELAYGVLWQSDLGASAVVDAVDQNLFGRGLTLGARARYRDDDRSARIYSAIPRLFGTRGAIQLFTEYTEHEDQDEAFLVDNESFEINVTASLPLRPHLTGRLYGRYLDITDTFVDSDPVFPLPPFEIAFAWPSLGFQAVYEGRDDPVATRRGTFASVDVSGADETVGSDFSYARLFTRATHHRGFELRSRPVVWAQSARLGLARSFREQELLSFEHLFAGGEYSIRGYDEEAIGPGVLERVEEQALLVVNEELHVPVWRDLLTGVLFIDAGNVWEEWGRLGDDFLTAIGLGLRASTPVGLVRLDVAYPLDQLPGREQKVKVYFGLGNAF